MALALFAGCGFSAKFSWLDICKNLQDEVEEVPAVSGPPATVFEEPGSIIVLHGRVLADRPDTSRFRVETTVNLPAYVNRATVFLNGWEAAYKGSDEHLRQLGAILGRIIVTPGGKITWNASGILDDYGGEEAFVWSYRYTVIAWNDASVRALVDHTDADNFCRNQEANADDNFFAAENDGNTHTTALASFPSLLRNPGFAGGRQVAVLPRGFYFGWRRNDNHLLQLGYNLESVAPFVRHQPYHKAYSTLNPFTDPTQARAHDEFVSWKTSVILKDNSRRRNYSFAELVSGVGGPDVEIIQPEFSLLPFEDADGGSAGAGLKSAEVVIENLPYLCAVPVLTGWEIGYIVEDQHVKEMGIFLDDVHYERPPGAATGRLRYKVFSILKDDDDFPDNYFRHKVTVLGFKPTGATGRPEGGGIK